MALYKKKELSPFDVINDEKKTVKDEPRIPFAQKNLTLSTRACVFMTGLILTLTLLVVSFGKAIIPLALAYGIVLFWCLTFRFIENCRTIPLNLFLNVLLVAGVYLIPGIAPDPGSFYCYMPLAAGLTVLGSSIKDGRAYYMRSYILEEIILPVLTGSACVALSAVISKYLFESKTTGVMLILSAIILGIISLVISSIWGKEALMSSGKLCAVSDYSRVDAESNKRFFIERGVFLLETVVIMIVITVGKILVMKYVPDLPYIIYVAVAGLAAMIFAFASGRRWDDIFSCESFIPVTIVPLFSPVAGVLISAGVDIVVMGYLHTYKRKKVFADVPKSFDGLPLLIIAEGLLIMAVEAVF